MSENSKSAVPNVAPAEFFTVSVFVAAVATTLTNLALPILLSLKRHYNRPRPGVLAKKLGLDLPLFVLKTAETPSYPSGHATQATYGSDTIITWTATGSYTA